MRFFFLLIAAAACNAADLTGTWEVTLRGGQVVDASRVQISQKDGAWTFGLSGVEYRGTETGGTIRLDCRENSRSCGTMVVRVDGNSITGSGDMDGIPMTFTAHRAAVRPATPTRHEFTPTEFYRQFSGDKPPALHIFPGDTVHTTTVDAGGRDADGKRRVFGGNPLTGPFYIEGAMPGDVIAVKLSKVRLSRDTAGSGDLVVPSALEPRVLRDQQPVKGFDSTWSLDRNAMVGRLKNPTEKLKDYRVPLRPMIGCIGVAPPQGQSFRSGELGDWGGNLDFNGMVEGVTVYLPVNAPGALLFIGDGHAAQGDGELTGDALETSMEMEFTVNLETGVRLNQPRIESDEYVMFSGVANSLTEALQRATTGLSRYLAQRYGLNAAEVGIVLGSGIRYDIAEIVDPKQHVVAKLPKKLLEGLR